MATITKKGQIKRKVSATDVEILHPETDAELVIYDNSTSELDAKTVQGAIDEVAAAIAEAGKVDDVKIQVDSGTPASIVSNKIATIPVTSSYSGTSETIVNGKAIKAAIDGLDVSEFNLAQTNTATNVVTLHGIKETDGKIGIGTTAGNNVTFYNTQGTNVAIDAKIATLDVPASGTGAITGFGAGKTLASLTETDGKIAATFQDISITESQVTNLTTDLANKVDKYTSSSNAGVVYGVSGSGTQTTFNLSRADGTTLAANEIPVRTTGGQIIVPVTPTADGHAASKKYVDDKITQGVEYLGAVDNTTELYALDSSAGEGDWVRVGTQFTYNTETCHVGDILVCSAEKGSSTHATWDVIHTEVDTDTNTTYQAIVGAAGTGYAGAVQLQYKNLGDSSWTNQDTIKFINGTSGKISISPNTANKTLTFEHAVGSGASKASGLYKFSTDSTSHISGVTAVAKADLTGLGVADDSLVVHKGTSSATGIAETIYGTKTFVNPILLNNSVDAESSTAVSLAGDGLSQDLRISAKTLSLVDANYDYNTIYDFEKGSISKSWKKTDGYDTSYLLLPRNKGTSSAPATLATIDDIPSVADFVKGPASATNNAIAVYDGTTGKLIKNSNITINNGTIQYTSGTLTLSGASNAGVAIASGQNLTPLSGTQNLGSGMYKWQDLYLSRNLTDGTNSTTIANIVAGLTTNVNSGKEANGSTDIAGSKSGTVITLGDSGIAVNEDSTKGTVGVATYSALMVNRKGIAVAGGQILDVIAHGGTPNVVNGGWYFEEAAA